METRARPRGVRRRRRGRLGRVRPRAASRGEIRAHLATHVETASSTLGLRANCEKNEERRERNVRENEERRRRRRGVIGTPRSVRGGFKARERVCRRAKTPFQRSRRFPDAYARTHFARLFACRRAKTKKNIALISTRRRSAFRPARAAAACINAHASVGKTLRGVNEGMLTSGDTSACRRREECAPGRASPTRWETLHQASWRVSTG